jgi:hypothetical protein
MNKDAERCINPWFGFFFIVLVCIMIAAAIFFESKETRRARGMHQKTAPNKATTRVNFPNPLGEGNTGGDRLIF